MSACAGGGGAGSGVQAEAGGGAQAEAGAVCVEAAWHHATQSTETEGGIARKVAR